MPKVYKYRGKKLKYQTIELEEDQFVDVLEGLPDKYEFYKVTCTDGIEEKSIVFHKSGKPSISKTKPNECYTIKELWQRWTQGNTPVTTKSIYFDSDNIEDLEELDVQDTEMIDRVDITDYLEKQEKKVKNLKLQQTNLEKRIKEYEAVKRANEDKVSEAVKNDE